VGYIFFASLQSHGPKVQDDGGLQVPLLKDKKRAGSKAPAVVLGEHRASSMHACSVFLYFSSKQNVLKPPSTRC
jgi:hypothetical protein